MTTPDRPKRSDVPPGFVDAIGLDDESIPFKPHVLTPPEGFGDALGMDHESITIEPIVIRRRTRRAPL